MKEKISMFYKQPNQLNDIIRILNIVIDFVISTGCSGNRKIIEYAVDTLKMTYDESNTYKQINELDLGYLESLWNILNLRRVILLTEHKQDPFDELEHLYRENIPIDLIQGEISNYSSDYSSDASEDEQKRLDRIECNIMDYIKRKKKYMKLKDVLSILNLVYKLIIYKLIKRESDEKNQEEVEEINPDMKLIHLLCSDEIDQTDNKEDQIDFECFNFENIQLKHIYHLWKLLVRIYLDAKATN